MTTPKSIIFSPAECQSLLDFIDKIRKAHGANVLPYTDEEHAAYEKLKKAGRFFIPYFPLPSSRRQS